MIILGKDDHLLKCVGSDDGLVARQAYVYTDKKVENMA